MFLSRPSLNPTSVFGTSARTKSALLVGSRSSIASQNRIYNFYQRKNEGYLYLAFLNDLINPPPIPPIPPIPTNFNVKRQILSVIVKGKSVLKNPKLIPNQNVYTS